MKPSALAALQQLVATYNLAGDRGQAEALAGLFAPDGVLETPLWRAEGPREIASALSRGAAFRDRRPALVRHHLTTSAFAQETAGAASGRSYFLVLTEIGPDHAGTYVDRFVRAGGVWMFARREVRIDWKASLSLFVNLPAGRGSPAAI